MSANFLNVTHPPQFLFSIQDQYNGWLRKGCKTLQFQDVEPFTLRFEMLAGRCWLVKVLNTKALLFHRSPSTSELYDMQNFGNAVDFHEKRLFP